jgi:hypothetical protein
MTTYSQAQQQLLSVLQITPLQVAAKFAADKPSAQSDVCANAAITAADLGTMLAQDIHTALTAGTEWFIDSSLSAATVQQNKLYTPSLALLQQPDAKRTLWALLSTLENTLDEI